MAPDSDKTPEERSDFLGTKGCARNMGWLVATLILTAILALRTHSQTVDWRQPVAINGIELEKITTMCRVLGRSEAFSAHDAVGSEWVFDGYGPLAMLKLSRQSDNVEDYRVTSLPGRVLSQGDHAGATGRCRFQTGTTLRSCIFYNAVGPKLMGR